MRLPGASSGLKCALAQVPRPVMRSEHPSLNADMEARTAPLPEICSTMHVAKCHYCARVGETLKYVAEQYNFDTNWLRLWNYNFELTDPVLPPPPYSSPPPSSRPLSSLLARTHRLSSPFLPHVSPSLCHVCARACLFLCVCLSPGPS